MNISDILSTLDKYKSDYQDFPKQSSYKEFADNISDFDEVISLLFFPSSCISKRVFLIVPSLFNSPNILTIGYPLDIISNLRKLGQVFLIDWQEIKDPNFKLENYVFSLNKLLLELSSKFDGKLDLIGHCLGGNLVLASAIFYQDVINSISLLSTPWNFSFLYSFRELHKKLSLDESIKDLHHIPALYFQILFFLMNQSSFEEKIDYYLDKSSNINLDTFFAIEQWQFSGNSIPRALYRELMDDIISRNIMFNKMWTINGKVLDPSVIKSNVNIIIGKKDKIVPYDSSNELSKIIPHSIKFEYNTGHIGYLIGSQREHFMLDLTNSLKNVGLK